MIVKYIFRRKLINRKIRKRYLKSSKFHFIFQFKIPLWYSILIFSQILEKKSVVPLCENLAAGIGSVSFST